MKKAFITLCIGELYWELARFVPYIIWKKKLEPETDLIVITRKDRYDLYGTYATKFFPVEIEGDGISKKAECFRLNNYDVKDYYKIIQDVHEQIKSQYDYVEEIYPKLEYGEFAKTGQFSNDKFSYAYSTRQRNKLIVDKYLDGRPVVVIAARFREGLKRNWYGWKEFYDLVDLELKSKFQIVLCGKKSEYVQDNRFLDVNDFELFEDTSLIGYSIELIKKSSLVIGTQSAIPSLALLLGTEVLQWGHNRGPLTSKEYNPMNTKQTFIDDKGYNRQTIFIFNSLKDILKGF